MVDLIIDSSSAAIKTHIENTNNRKIWNTQNRENVTIVSKLNIATFLTVTCVKRIFWGRGDVYTDNHFQQSHQVNWMPNEKSRGNL